MRKAVNNPFLINEFKSVLIVWIDKESGEWVRTFEEMNFYEWIDGVLKVVAGFRGLISFNFSIFVLNSYQGIVLCLILPCLDLGKWIESLKSCYDWVIEAKSENLMIYGPLVNEIFTSNPKPSNLRLQTDKIPFNPNVNRITKPLDPKMPVIQFLLPSYTR